MRVFLPQDKLVKVCSLVNTMVHQRIVNDLHTLELLVGHLVYASKISPLGQVFHTNLFAVLSAMKEGHYRRLNLAARAGMVAGMSCLLVRHLGSTLLIFGSRISTYSPMPLDQRAAMLGMVHSGFRFCGHLTWS